jgi:hypothetical protein
MTRETRLVSLVYVVCLVERTHRMNEPKQMSQINSSRQSSSTVPWRRPAILDPVWDRNPLILQRLSPSPQPMEVG